MAKLENPLGQVLVLVNTVISRSSIDRSERKAARENARVVSSFVVVATLVYSLFRSTCIYANTDANPPVFEMICSNIASGRRRVKKKKNNTNGREGNINKEKEMRNQASLMKRNQIALL